jgi:peptidoglycan/xylan/chitin deacetylase (PgdA/CDA1 family)
MNAQHPVPILSYHSLDESGSVVSVSPRRFRRQVRSLRRRGYQGISLGHLLDGWDGLRELPARPVVLTFDDGFRNVLQHAAPALREAGFSATLFAVAGRCGQDNDWPGQPSDIPRLPLLSTGELRQLSEEGFEVGSHGMTHTPLTGLPRDRQRRELIDSRHLLEDALGREVRLFAYPCGRHDDGSRALVGQEYRAACATALGLARSSADRRALPRVETFYYRSMPLFHAFPGPVGLAWLRVRALGRMCRAALS